MKKPLQLLAAVSLGILGSVGAAQIQRLDLTQMSNRADNGVFGEIVASKVFRVDHPRDGMGQYFTTLTIAGSSLFDGTSLTVDVTFVGGWDYEKNEGLWNSEAPLPDDVKVGNRIVAFYKWTDNMGSDVAANALYAAHGGLYRAIGSSESAVVLGRGDGFAIRNNMQVGQLRTNIQLARGAK